MDGYIFHLPRERSRVRKDIRNNGVGEFVKGRERERRWKKIAELRGNVNVKRERMDDNTKIMDDEKKKRDEG